MGKEPQDEATIAVKKAMFERFRSCFPSASKDVEIARIMGIKKQPIHKYKYGLNLFDIVAMSQRFPNLDWHYIITGKETIRPESPATDNFSLANELSDIRRGVFELAKYLQQIEEKITK